MIYMRSCITCRVPCIEYMLSCVARRTLCTVCMLSCIDCKAPCIACMIYCIARKAPCMVCILSCVVRKALCITHKVIFLDIFVQIYVGFAPFLTKLTILSKFWSLLSKSVHPLPLVFVACWQPC